MSYMVLVLKVLIKIFFFPEIFFISYYFLSLISFENPKTPNNKKIKINLFIYISPSQLYKTILSLLQLSIVTFSHKQIFSHPTYPHQKHTYLN